MAIAFFRSHALQAGPDVLSVILHLICLAKNVQTSIHLSRPFTKLHSSQCKAKAAPQPEPQPKLHSPQCTTTPLNAQPHHSVHSHTTQCTATAAQPSVHNHSHTTQCTATPLSAQPQLHSPQCTATAAQPSVHNHSHSPQCTATPLNAQPHHSVHSHTTQCTTTAAQPSVQYHSHSCTALRAQQSSSGCKDNQTIHCLWSKPLVLGWVDKIIRQYIVCGQHRRRAPCVCSSVRRKRMSSAKSSFHRLLVCLMQSEGSGPRSTLLGIHSPLNTPLNTPRDSFSFEHC